MTCGVWTRRTVFPSRPSTRTRSTARSTSPWRRGGPRRIHTSRGSPNKTGGAGQGIYSLYSLRCAKARRRRRRRRRRPGPPSLARTSGFLPMTKRVGSTTSRERRLTPIAVSPFAEPDGKVHRVDPDFGSTLTVTNRDSQSNCWVNWKTMGQTCEFQVLDGAVWAAAASPTRHPACVFLQRFSIENVQGHIEMTSPPVGDSPQKMHRGA
jgi:hypothetical protein